MSQQPSSSIPFYDLYGEAFIRSDPGFIHIEEIAHRSKGLGWEIKPHRHNRLAQIVVVLNNDWHVKMDDKQHNLRGNWAVIIPPGVVHGFRFSSDTYGFVLSINTDFIGNKSSVSTNSDYSGLMWEPLTIECANTTQLLSFQRYIGLLQTELAQNEVGQQFAINQLLQLTLQSLYRQQHLDSLHGGPSSRESKTLLQFRQLIENHYVQHLSVKDYAEKLHISVSTLNRLCQQLLNESPKAIIHQRLASEAKRRLIYTKQTVEEIAFTLGFRDPAYFSRFFKQIVGQTAGQFRATSNIT